MYSNAAASYCRLDFLGILPAACKALLRSSLTLESHVQRAVHHLEDEDMRGMSLLSNYLSQQIVRAGIAKSYLLSVTLTNFWEAIVNARWR